MRSVTLPAAIAVLAVAAGAAQDFRLVRSVSGPSGKVSGSTLAFDEVRSRFVHPQDKSLMVYCEWEAAPGAYALSALWKGPDGGVSTISPDVKIETATRTLTCYWTFTLDPEMPPGVWTVEVRLNGQPAAAE
jgi:hypothetical protein